LVGSVVDLLAIEETEYKSLEPAGYINFVSKGDARVVNICNSCCSILNTDYENHKGQCNSCRIKEM
jgi:hypothetical protein